MGRPSTNVRAQSMHKRRDRLLAEARALFTVHGFEALNLRELARLAEVTVPTIYNLIGNKEEVLVALFAEVLTEIEARIRDRASGDALERAGAVAVVSTDLFAEDQNYYRSAFLAVEFLNQSGAHHDKVTQIYAWGERMATDGVVACSQAALRPRCSVHCSSCPAIRSRSRPRVSRGSPSRPSVRSRVRLR